MKLLETEHFNGRRHRYWLHPSERGKGNAITVETTQDVAPIIKQVKSIAELGKSKDFRFKATIPGTMLEDAAKINAKRWGISVRAAFTELVKGKTDRAKREMKVLTEGRDFRKLQAKAYQV